MERFLAQGWVAGEWQDLEWNAGLAPSLYSNGCKMSPEYLLSADCWGPCARSRDTEASKQMLLGKVVLRRGKAQRMSSVTC